MCVFLFVFITLCPNINTSPFSMHGLRASVPYGAAVRIPSEVSLAFTKASLLKILYCALPSTKMHTLIAVL